MKIQRKLVVLSATLVLLISACKNKEEQNKHFEAFKDRFIESYWQLNPTAALYAGYHKYDTILPIPDSSYISSQFIAYKQWEDSLTLFDVDALSESNKTDWLILNNTVKAAQWY